MKETKISKVQTLDSMGRIHIPMLLLELANIKPVTKVQFYSYTNCVVIKKIQDFSFYKETNSINFIRKIDDLGRVVIPKSIRKVYDLGPYENVKIDVVNKQIILHKISKENKSLHLTKPFIEAEINSCFQTKVKNNKINLADFIMELLNLKANMDMQFFIKDKHTIIAKKHQYKFYTKNNLYFTGQSRTLDKHGWLNIPKKLRDHLKVYNGDTIEIKVVQDQLVIKRAK
ncbi:AbrB/MazE/SpoVT family DNA-binding domain-containing protein [Priestia sp. YIM B13448]|uniref:AbrB/MazE/SpoVT family DNA-binding domain-containing protein n=1 Tax=Priestia sp. YIM B13448 TaxID=3366308 RepID=UPI003671A080